MASAVRGFSPLLRLYAARLSAKGKVESGVKYVKRNALAGRRFTSWEDLNSWLERWSVEVADLRIHGTTHERPADRFVHEQLTPLGARPPYRYERVQTRQVANDALVTVGVARYSVPVAYVGKTVSVHEEPGHFEYQIGYLPIDRQGANLFFQLVSRRYERGSIIITSNQSLGTSGWGSARRSWRASFSSWWWRRRAN